MDGTYYRISTFLQIRPHYYYLKLRKGMGKISLQFHGTYCRPGVVVLFLLPKGLGE